MDVFISLILIVFITVSAFVMPWVNLLRIQALKRTIQKLSSALEKAGIDDPEITSIQDITPTADTQMIHMQNDCKEEVMPANTAEELSLGRQVKTIQQYVLEQNIGTKLYVWIGGIALALAGFFLVKYSIDNNLLSPAARVILGGVFGMALICCSKWVGSNPDFSNGNRIAQSLAGAGIAVLYTVFYVSVRLYEFIPIWTGLYAMAAVTATALVLSLRNGPPIALLGMAGGFSAPGLLGISGDHELALFIHLYFITSGLLIVARKTKWWWLSIPSIIAPLVWVVIWLFSSHYSGDSMWMGLFLVGISATIVISSNEQYEKDGGGTRAGLFKLTSILNYMGHSGALVLMGIIARKAGFGFMEWGLFSLLALGGIGLSYFNDKLYGFVPWISMVVTAMMLYSWGPENDSLLAHTLAIFAVIYAGSSLLLMFRARVPTLWAGHVSVTSLLYYLLAYHKLRSTTLFANIHFFWGLVALVLVVVAVCTLFKIQKYFAQDENRESLYAVFSTMAISFIALALCIELEREFLPVAIAGEMLVIAWINSKTSVKALRIIIAIFACIFGLLLLPQIALILQLSLDKLLRTKLHQQLFVPLVQWPLFHLGVPAMMFIGSSYFLRQQQDNRLVRIFEITAIALGAFMGYYFTRNSLHPDQNVLLIKVAFFERGVITNVLFMYGLACFWVGRRSARKAFSWSGIVLCAIAAFRIIYFDMLTHNPIWEAQKIVGIAVFNSLLLPYGFPFVWAYLASKELVGFGKDKLAWCAGAFMIVALLALVTTNVRYIYHGEYLNMGMVTYAEMYTYTVAWLLLGMVLLFIDFIKQDKMLRIASLSIILLTVGKVFVCDISELTGLYRVFSFFGLGSSLIGLSYFYTRFILGRLRMN